MTETDAKVKWCPFVRSTDGRDISAFNAGTLPDERNPPTARCIGSGCMAWRWGDGPQHSFVRMPDAQFASSRTEPERPAGLPASWTWDTSLAEEGEARWLEPQEEAVARRRGYCGLAGKPEFL